MDTEIKEKPPMLLNIITVASLFALFFYVGPISPYLFPVGTIIVGLWFLLSFCRQRPAAARELVTGYVLFVAGVTSVTMQYLELVPNNYCNSSDILILAAGTAMMIFALIGGSFYYAANFLQYKNSIQPGEINEYKNLAENIRQPEREQVKKAE